MTIGFAAKDLITNTFAGIFVLFSRPFHRGSVITVNGFKGKVLSMDLRYVKLYNEINKSEILVPLSVVYGNVITVEKN